MFLSQIVRLTAQRLKLSNSMDVAARMLLWPQQGSASQGAWVPSTVYKDSTLARPPSVANAASVQESTPAKRINGAVGPTYIFHPHNPSVTLLQAAYKDHFWGPSR